MSALFKLMLNYGIMGLEVLRMVVNFKDFGVFEFINTYYRI